MGDYKRDKGGLFGFLRGLYTARSRGASIAFVPGKHAKGKVHGSGKNAARKRREARKRERQARRHGRHR